MRTGSSLLACVLLSFALSPAGVAKESTTRSAVEVSKRAASMPGSSYAWIEMPKQLEAEFDARVQDPKLRTRLQAALDKAMQAKGYRQAASAKDADIAIAYRVGVRDVEQPDIDDAEAAIAPEAEVRCGVGGCSQIVVQDVQGVRMKSIKSTDYVQGGLLVEVLEPGQIRVLWRALYRGEVRAGSGSIDLDEVAQQTLSQLPQAPSAAP